MRPKTTKITKTKLDRNMALLYNELKRIEIPNFAKKEAERIFRIALERRLTMSYPKREIIAATIYYVVKRYKLPYLLNELCEIFDVKRKKLLQVVKFLKRNLQLPTEEHPTDVYIIKIGSELEMPQKIITEALKMNLENISNPRVRAGIALIKAAKKNKYKLNKSKLSKLLGVSLTAIRKNLNK